MPAARETRTAVIVMHGFSGHRLPELAAFVPWLQERHHVLQFDFRGHGESEGSMVTLGTHERRDVAAAVRFLESRGLGPIALFGISMGASIAIVSAPDLPVAAVVADAAFAELRHPVANRLREGGYPLSELGARVVVGGAMLRTRARLAGPIRAVAGIAPRPLLLIAPREDQLISWRQSLRLYEAAGEPKELMVVEGAGPRRGLCGGAGGISAPRARLPGALPGVGHRYFWRRRSTHRFSGMNAAGLYNRAVPPSPGVSHWLPRRSWSSTTT